MRVAELLVFSTCSSKIHRLISLSKLNVETLNYEFDEEKPMELTIGGMTVQFSWDDDEIWCYGTVRDRLPLVFYNHLNSMFSKSSPTNELIVRPFKNSLNSFPILPGVTDIEIKNNQFEVTELEKFIANYPKQQNLAISSTMTGNLSLDSKLFRMERICLKHTDHHTSSILKNYTGQTAFLSDSIYDEESIIEFLNDWIKGKKQQTPNALWLRFKEGTQFNFLFIIEKFRAVAKVWDQARSLEAFEFYRRMERYYLKLPRFLMVLQFMDIRRETDGQLASFSIDPTEFMFIVWNQDVAEK